jgi:electron transport complex protein RnfG
MMKLPDFIKFPIVLIIVAGISAVALAFLYQAALPAKERIQAQITESAYKVVMPDAATFEDAKAEVDGAPFEYKIAKSINGEVLGYIAEGSAEGYSSKLRVMVGVKKDFTINALKVLYQKETPGLGDKVNEIISKKTWWTVITGTSPDEAGLRPWFQSQFDGKEAPVKVQKDGGTIDAITGATISSRAVCHAVNEAVEDLKQAIQQ